MCSHATEAASQEPIGGVREWERERHEKKERGREREFHFHRQTCQNKFDVCYVFPVRRIHNKDQRLQPRLQLRLQLELRRR